MSKPMDVGCAIRAGAIPNWNIQDSQAKNRSGKDELEISKRIEVAEFLAPLYHPGIVMPRHELCAAQRVADKSVQHAAQRFGEENISEVIEKAHGLAFHRINQAATVNEIR